MIDTLLTWGEVQILTAITLFLFAFLRGVIQQRIISKHNLASVSGGLMIVSQLAIVIGTEWVGFQQQVVRGLIVGSSALSWYYLVIGVFSVVRYVTEDIK